MGISETEAIVLRTYKLAEADKITVFLSRNFGVMRGVARGARRLKSKFGAALEPYTLISLSYYEKEGQELVGIRQADILRSYFELSKNTEIIIALEYLSGLILEFTAPHEPNEKVFRMFRVCLEALAGSPEDLRQIIRYGEIWLLKLSGFLPDLLACVKCKNAFEENGGTAYFGIDGGLRCTNCASTVDQAVGSETTSYLRLTGRLSPQEWSGHGRIVTEATRRELSQLIHRLITRALERLPKGRSAVE